MYEHRVYVSKDASDRGKLNDMIESWENEGWELVPPIAMSQASGQAFHALLTFRRLMAYDRQCQVTKRVRGHRYGN